MVCYFINDGYLRKIHKKKLISGYSDVIQAWAQELADQIKTANRYDTEIKLCADYRLKWKIDPRNVWRAIADIKKPLTKYCRCGNCKAAYMADQFI